MRAAVGGAADVFGGRGSDRAFGEGQIADAQRHQGGDEIGRGRPGVRARLHSMADRGTLEVLERLRREPAPPRLDGGGKCSGGVVADRAGGGGPTHAGCGPHRQRGHARPLEAGRGGGQVSDRRPRCGPDRLEAGCAAGIVEHMQRSLRITAGASSGCLADDDRGFVDPSSSSGIDESQGSQRIDRCQGFSQTGVQAAGSGCAVVDGQQQVAEFRQSAGSAVPDQQRNDLCPARRCAHTANRLGHAGSHRPYVEQALCGQQFEDEVQPDAVDPQRCAQTVDVCAEGHQLGSAPGIVIEHGKPPDHLLVERAVGVDHCDQVGQPSSCFDQQGCLIGFASIGNQVFDRERFECKHCAAPASDELQRSQRARGRCRSLDDHPAGVIWERLGQRHELIERPIISPLCVEDDHVAVGCPFIEA